MNRTFRISYRWFISKNIITLTGSFNALTDSLILNNMIRLHFHLYRVNPDANKKYQIKIRSA